MGRHKKSDTVTGKGHSHKHKHKEADALKTESGKVWVQDASRLKSIEGTNQTLSGTEYYGESL